LFKAVLITIHELACKRDDIREPLAVHPRLKTNGSSDDEVKWYIIVQTLGWRVTQQMGPLLASG
jgi:hypothetical protein